MALKTALFAWTFTSASWLLLVDAAVILPGVNDKPGDSNAMDTLLACREATSELLMVPAVAESLASLHQSAVVQLKPEAACIAEGDDTICTLDYSSLIIPDEADYKSVCESNGGVYDENDQQVTCQVTDDPTMTGSVIYRFTNYPTCFSNSCESSDLERWIADEVDSFESDVEQETSWVCDSNYEIEETSGTKQTCPNRVNDSPQICGPLLANVTGQECDCYAFCDGKPLVCEPFGSDGASDVFCTGELVMGCSSAVVAKYYASQQENAAAAGSKLTVLVASPLSLLVAVVALMML